MRWRGGSEGWSLCDKEEEIDPRVLEGGEEEGERAEEEAGWSRTQAAESSTTSAASSRTSRHEHASLTHPTLTLPQLRMTVRLRIYQLTSSSPPPRVLVLRGRGQEQKEN